MTSKIGKTRKPLVKAYMAPYFIELAQTVTLSDPEDKQKTAKFLLDLGEYLQSPVYAERRKRLNKKVALSRTREKTDE